MALEYARGTQFLLKSHPHFRESWLRDRIADDPALLGLGPLRLVDVERRHPRAGRLDLLLQQGQQRRYVVEIMLGRLDESHLVRSIEYWDAEQRASPGYEHVAVLAAEELPPRLLRVLELLRDHVPMVVLQMCAMQWENRFVLHFIRLLEGPGRSERPRPEPEPGRTAWEDKMAAPALAALDECLGVLREVVPRLHLEYRKHSLAVRSEAHASPLLVFYPKRHFLRVEIQAAQVSSLWERCPAASWQELEAGPLLHAVELLLFPGDVARKRGALEQVLRAAQREASAVV